MSFETTKSNSKRRKFMPLYQRIFKGDVIDIGCGPDPVSQADFPNIKSVTPFDLEHGDANRIDEYFKDRQFDVVYGSQVLEHLYAPNDAINRFLKITKVGGHVVMSVPDFVLYEGCVFPSRKNPDHKTVWGVKKPEHARGVGVYKLLECIPNIEILLIMLCDTDYDYSLDKSVDQTLPVTGAEAWVEFAIRRTK
jgi:SAM-dependent methyltransferase